MLYNWKKTSIEIPFIAFYNKPNHEVVFDLGKCESPLGNKTK